MVENSHIFTHLKTLGYAFLNYGNEGTGAHIAYELPPLRRPVNKTLLLLHCILLLVIELHVSVLP